MGIGGLTPAMNMKISKWILQLNLIKNGGMPPGQAVFLPAFSKHESHHGETKVFYQRFANWLTKEGGFQRMCDWWH